MFDERLSVRQWSSRRSEVSGAISSIRSISSPWGTCRAASRCDSSHSFCSRTSISLTPSAISACARSSEISSIPLLPWPVAVDIRNLLILIRIHLLLMENSSGIQGFHRLQPGNRLCGARGPHGFVVAFRGPPEQGLDDQAQTQVRAQRQPAEVLATRTVGAPDGGAPVERAGRPPALPSAVHERGGALAVMDEAARLRVEPRMHAGGGRAQTEVDVLSEHVQPGIERPEATQ